ncbi:MAG: 23S rRNA (pseudouridine(1915)-N(3))-methyltransferase RlmH [Pseudomonadota bacterium]|nr:23S rRNA (pseudouridine(1915)-N(3))-methyltransferase RlmH [Pseudomonadota bacterium]
MNINFLLIESSRPQWSETAFESYKSKFNKSITISWNGIKPATRNKNYSVSEVVQKESALLKKKIKEHDFVIALDKEGINLDTEKLKSNFENWIASSKDVTFVIGGPDGLSYELIEESNFCWSLSQLTFPHAVVPILVLEQIYRAWSMTQNHPYHR